MNAFVWVQGPSHALVTPSEVHSHGVCIYVCQKSSIRGLYMFFLATVDA